MITYDSIQKQLHHAMYTVLMKLEYNELKRDLHLNFSYLLYFYSMEKDVQSGKFIINYTHIQVRPGHFIDEENKSHYT